MSSTAMDLNSHDKENQRSSDINKRTNFPPKEPSKISDHLRNNQKNDDSHSARSIQHSRFQSLLNDGANKALGM